MHPESTFLIKFALLCAFAAVSISTGCADNPASTSAAAAGNKSPGAPKGQSGTKASLGLSPELVEPSTAIKSAPLAAVDKRGSSPFKLFKSEQTGIDFTMLWEPQDASTPIRGIGSTGAAAGVCIGDYDEDGRPDVFLTRPFGGNRLYRNLGEFKFEDVTETAGLTEELEYDAWGAGPCFVDIDNDNDLDLYVCSHRRANRLYINQGDGKFVERAKQFGLDFSGASITMAFADYDLDGDLDAYLVTNWLVEESQGNQDSFAEFRDGRMRTLEEVQEKFDVIRLPSGKLKVIRGAQLDHFYRNDGGKFVEATRQVLGDHSASENFFGHAARWFDYDEDGYPDLYISNDFYGPDQFFHNNGDGTLTDVTKSALPHIPWYSMGSDAGDVNNDGRLDFMAADMAFTTHFKSKVSMGDMDAASWFLDMSDPKQQMSNVLFVNTGTNRFVEAAGLAGISNTDWTWAIKLGDLDNDGKLDIYITNGMTRNWFDSDIRQRAKTPADGDDSDFEEKWETVWKNESPLREKNVAYRNLGDLDFAKVSDDWGLGFEGTSFGSAMGDLDGDGDLDIVTVNFEDQAHVLRNDVSQNHRAVFRLRGVESNRQAIGAVVKLRTDGGLQVRDLPSVRGFLSADDPKLYFGLGEHDIIRSLTIRWPSGIEQSFENLPADKLYTITEAGQIRTTDFQAPAEPMFRPFRGLPPIKHQEQEFDDFALQPLLPNRLSRLGPGIACGDINGDGIDDYYIAAAKGSLGRVLLGDGESLKLSSRSDAFLAANRESEEMAPLLFDADGDGDLDLFISNGSYEDQPESKFLQDRLYLNQGDGRFFPAGKDAMPALKACGSGVAAADFDRDGDLDLFVGSRVVPGSYPDTPRSVLLQNNGGTFTDVTENIAPGLDKVGLVTSAVWSDADGDGWIDLLVTCEWGPIALWHNKEGKLIDATTEARLASHPGWWNGITAGDIDNDGDIDYVATNFGLSTKYHASPDQPAVVYYGDVDNNGKKDLIEAKYSNDQLLPVRGKSCSTNAIPMLGEKCTTYHQFASLMLEDLYGADKLNSSTRLECTTLESSLLVNDGKGHFDVRQLPRIAQVSPGFAAAIVDVDADGHLDVYMLQNFYNPQRETVRMDGGVSQLLLGSKGGNLQPVWPNESGLVMPKDAKALSVTDFNADGRPDFLITVNNGELSGFENQTESQNQTFAVKLAGKTGNPTGVGSLVTLELSDGSKQTAEVYCGGGYLSQSSATLYFGCGAEHRPQSVGVRWPDGSESTQQVDENLHSLTLEQPVQ